MFMQSVCLLICAVNAIFCFVTDGDMLHARPYAAATFVILAVMSINRR